MLSAGAPGPSPFDGERLLRAAQDGLLDPVGMPLVTGVKHLRVQFTPGGGGKAL